jgi:hypothetical protein
MWLTQCPSHHSGINGNCLDCTRSIDWTDTVALAAAAAAAVDGVVGLLTAGVYDHANDVDLSELVYESLLLYNKQILP